jgi:hypothetical protein
MFPGRRSPALFSSPALALVVLSLAPAPPDQPPPAPAPIPVDQVAFLTALLKDRYQAAQKQFELIWLDYKQGRSGAFPVYIWSHSLLRAQMDMTNDKAQQIAALEAHHKHMKDLESLAIKVRQLGLGLQSEVAESEYFRIEAEYWLAHARAASEAPAPIPADRAAAVTELLHARYRAARKLFDQAWSIYKQARPDPRRVSVWSHFLMQAQRDMTNDKAQQIAALEAHLARIKDLETLMIKRRRFGVAQPVLEGTIEYFRLEAEYWVAEARATPEAPAPRPALATGAAQDQFGKAWSIYKRARSDAYPVCVWSQLLLQAQMDMANDNAARIAALSAHRTRLEDLETLAIKVRRIGLGLQSEVGETEYFRLEAEYWLALARSQRDDQVAAPAPLSGQKRGDLSSLLLLRK